METNNIVYLTPENAVFYEKDGFLALKANIIPKTEYDLEEEKELTPVWQDLGRVFLHRAFPFNNPNKFISVLDSEGYEYGIINDVSDFDSKTGEIIRKALDRKYFMPKITKIISVKDKFGFSFWQVETDRGTSEFSVKDTFKSIIHISENKIIILDSDDGRYLIEDVLKLDSSSYKKIELYL